MGFGVGVDPDGTWHYLNCCVALINNVITIKMIWNKRKTEWGQGDGNQHGVGRRDILLKENTMDRGKGKGIVKAAWLSKIE